MPPLSQLLHTGDDNGWKESVTPPATSLTKRNLRDFPGGGPGLQIPLQFTQIKISVTIQLRPSLGGIFCKRPKYLVPGDVTYTLEGHPVTKLKRSEMLEPVFCFY